jgi:hypothetical protein
MADYTRMKTVVVSQRIEDLPGLFRDLKNAFFNVVNVAGDKHGTYLYMDVSEKKDPRPIVEFWVDRPLSVQRPTTSLLARLFRKIW